jgi:hypothetical protein
VELARVLILGGREPPGEGLVDALGSERAAAVRALLVGRARAWARGAFGDRAVRVVAESSFTAALTDGAAESAGPRPAGAVLIIAPELPVWHPEIAPAVRDDLAAGCALSLAPIFDRGLYLLAVADPSAARTAALAALDLAGPGGMGQLISLADRERWEVGLLRAERGLRRARDVRALLADPLTDPELRALLG